MGMRIAGSARIGVRESNDQILWMALGGVT